MLWILTKGDLVLSNQPATSVQHVGSPFVDTDNHRRKLTIYSYDDDDRPIKMSYSISGMSTTTDSIMNARTCSQAPLAEFQVSHELEYSLNDIPLQEVQKFKTKKGLYYDVQQTLTLTPMQDGLHSALYFNGVELTNGKEAW
jgi:hypothetical protein